MRIFKAKSVPPITKKHSRFEEKCQERNRKYLENSFKTLSNRCSLIQSTESAHVEEKRKKMSPLKGDMNTFKKRSRCTCYTFFGISSRIAISI